LLTRDDIQNGNTLDTPAGDRRVAGRVVTDGGPFIILADSDGVGSLYSEGELYDHEEMSVKNRPAVSGVAAAQDASQVEALTAKVDQQSKMIDALMERDQTREQEVEALRSREQSSTDSTDTTDESGDKTPPPVPGPAAISEPTTPAPVTGDTAADTGSDATVATSPSAGEGAAPSDASTQGQTAPSEGAS
jgi:hypothetical protein